MIDIEAGYLSVVIIIKAVKTSAKPISKGCFELRDLKQLSRAVTPFTVHAKDATLF